MRRAAVLPFAILCCALLFRAPVARALEIQIIPGVDLAANPDALAAFERAAAAWTIWIDDPVTIVINANLAPLGPNVLGEAESVFLYGDNFAEIRDAMVQDDFAEGGWFVQALPTFSQLSATLPEGRTLLDSMRVTQANLKALGFTGVEAISGHVEDGTIVFSSNFSFDFDNSDGIGFGQFDFETAVAHEIGHVLGFISGVDDLDQTTAQELPEVYLTPLDLFRFGAGTGKNPFDLSEFTSFARDLVPGNLTHFDDLTDEWLFATGANRGDGTQASHWKDDAQTGTLVIDENGTRFEPGPLIGIMDPTLDSGVAYGPTRADLRALDGIGYRIVPEPGSALLIALGAGILGRPRRPARGTRPRH